MSSGIRVLFGFKTSGLKIERDLRVKGLGFIAWREIEELGFIVYLSLRMPQYQKSQSIRYLGSFLIFSMNHHRQRRIINEHGIYVVFQGIGFRFFRFPKGMLKVQVPRWDVILARRDTAYLSWGQ